MEAKEAVVRLEQSSIFLDWKKDNPKAYLANAFMMMDPAVVAEWQVGYYVPDTDRITTFGVGDKITKNPESEVFKEKNANVIIVAVEPASSPVLSGGEAGPHKIQGIGAGFIPEVLNRSLLDQIITVTDEEAYQTTKQLAKKEGLLVGISTGANVFAAQKVAEALGPGKNVVTVLCDTGERYLSMEKYFNI